GSSRQERRSRSESRQNQDGQQERGCRRAAGYYRRQIGRVPWGRRRCRCLRWLAETNRREIQSVRTFRPMSLASVSRLRNVALRLNGDQIAEKTTGSGSSAKGRKTMPVVGNSAVAAPTIVM